MLRIQHKNAKLTSISYFHPCMASAEYLIVLSYKPARHPLEIVRPSQTMTAIFECFLHIPHIAEKCQYS